jgi:hypothetical protein
MKPFASESLAEVGVFAIRQTLRRIIREFEDDPNTAVRRTIDAETKKKAIDVDLIAAREFATQFRHYDGGRYASVIATGEERPGDTVSANGTFCTYVLVDALDGSDLAERGLANWCSAAAFFDVTGFSAKIRAAVVGMPPNQVYFATDDDPRVRVYRDLPDLDLSRPQPTPISIPDLEEALLHPKGVQLQFMAAANERLANQLFPILRPSGH